MHWDRVHGDEPGAFDAADFELAGLANVDQAEGFSGGEACFYFCGTNLHCDVRQSVPFRPKRF